MGTGIEMSSCGQNPRSELFRKKPKGQDLAKTKPFSLVKPVVLKLSCGFPGAAETARGATRSIQDSLFYTM